MNNTDSDNRLQDVTSNRNELNELSKKVKAISTKDYSFFLGRISCRNYYELQNTFVYQLGFRVIKYYNTRTGYIIIWRSKGVYNTKLIPIKNDYFPNIKYFEHKIEIRFNYTPLIVEQNSYTTKTVNVYIVYDLDDSPENSNQKLYNKKLFVWSDYYSKK